MDKLTSFYYRFSALLLLAVCFQFNAIAAESGQWRWNNVERIVVIPDIHGAFPAFVQLLQSTDMIDSSLNWVGDTAHLVSLGDILDRGAESRKAMGLLMRLQQQALQVGGRVHVVAGNHELMNLIGDLRYVAKQEYQAFSADETVLMRNEAFQDFQVNTDKNFETEASAWTYFDKQYPAGYFAHRKAFSAQGEYGRWILALPAVVVINNLAFVHGGLPKIVAESGLDDLNKKYQNSVTRYLQLWQELIDAKILPKHESNDVETLARTTLKNATFSDCVKEREETCVQLQQQKSTNGSLTPEMILKLEEFIALSEHPVLSTEGPLWYRGANYCREIYEGPILDASLGKLGVSRVIVGHTTTPDARAHNLHDNKLTMLDTGMLVKYYSGRPAALMIENDQFLVQYLDPNERLAISSGLPGAYGLTHEQQSEALKLGQIKVLEKPVGSQLGVSKPWTVQVSHKGKTLNAIYYPHDRLSKDELELNAYALDQLLGFELVPITVARTLENATGALQLSYQDGISEQERLDKRIVINGWCPLNRQIQLTYAWDLLTANTGRNADNLLYRKHMGLIYLIDHANAFGLGKRLSKSLKSDRVKMTPEIRQALASLNEDILTQSMDGRLDKRKIQALLSRRDAMLKLFR